jgi:uncharacterized membrane protein YjfL (UPF0719 family)
VPQPLLQKLHPVLGSGLPMLLLQFVICIILLAAGLALYTRATPFHDRELLRKGNIAASTVFTGAVLALTNPRAALLVTAADVLEIVVWVSWRCCCSYDCFHLQSPDACNARHDRGGKGSGGTANRRGLNAGAMVPV